MGLYEEICIDNDMVEIKETNKLPSFHGLIVSSKTMQDVMDTRRRCPYVLS